MMIDKWDELWTRSLELEPEIGRVLPLDWLVSKDWLYEVKAEGDKLKRALVQLEIPERMEMHEQLKAAKQILNDVVGVEVTIFSKGDESSRVEYSAYIKYYHAVCNALDILEGEE